MPTRDAYFQGFENVGPPLVPSRDARHQAYENVGGLPVFGPVAEFTWTATGLEVAFDASPSTSPGARRNRIGHFQGYENVT